MPSQCSSCAFPNSSWTPRCGRCGRKLHSTKETVLAIVIALSVLVAAIVLGS